MSETRSQFQDEMNRILSGAPDPAPPSFLNDLKSGALDLGSGVAAAFGRSGFDAGQEMEKEQAALAPPAPDLGAALTAGRYGEAAAGVGHAAAASSPQMALTLGAAAAAFPFGGPLASAAAAGAVNLPYWYGKNRLGQVEAGSKYEDINETRAAAAAVGQSAADTLVTLLFPGAKILPGLGKTILGRIGKGGLMGALEGATSETAQEVMSILNQDPSLSALVTPEALNRLKQNAEYGAAIGSPLGAGLQAQVSTPSARRSPEDVEAESRSRRYFTPASIRAGSDDDIRWMDPNEIIRLSGQKKVKAAKGLVFARTPVLNVRDDGSGGVGVYGHEGLEIAKAAADRGLSTVPVRINGLKGAKFLSWDGQSINLEQEPYTAPGTGSATDPVSVSRETDLEPARRRAARGRTAGWIKLQGLDIAIDTPRDGLRRGTGPDGRPWATKAPADYGHIKRGQDADGEPLDVWLGPKPMSPAAIVIEQQDPVTGKFDEHKAMIGFETEADAITAYDAAFPDGSGPARRGQTVTMPMSKFRAWAGTGDTRTPLTEAMAENALPVTAEDINDLTDSMGVATDNDPGFTTMLKSAFGTADLRQMREPQLRQLQGMLEKARETQTPVVAASLPLVMSWEAEPSPHLQNGHLQPRQDEVVANPSRRRTDNSEYNQAVAYNNAISHVLVDDAGNDRIGKALGIQDLTKVVGPGWWDGKSVPATQQQLMLENSDYFRPGAFDLGDGLKVEAPRLTTTSRALLGSYAAARGLALKQDGVGWHVAHPVENPETANGLDIDLGEPADPAQVRGFISKLKKAGVGDDVIPIPTPFGMRLFRPLTESGGVFKGHDRTWAAKAADVADQHFRRGGIGYNFTESGVIGNDWKENPHGQTYAKAFDAAATAHARTELGSVLDDIDRVELRESDRRGLGFDRNLNRAIRINALGEGGREQAPNRKAAASIPLGGLDKGPVAQTEIYNLFGSTRNASSETIPGITTDIRHYDLTPIKNRPWLLDKMLDRYGFRAKYFSFDDNPDAGVHWQPPDLKRDGYSNGTVWIYNPKNEAGSFSDPEYTNAWRIPHEIGHALTEQLVQRRYGVESQREGRLGRVGTSYRGAPGKQVEIETRPLTLKEAQRALEWEDLAFRAQRQILDGVGVGIDDDAFNSEYNTNLADATYRILFGDFGDPGKRGFVPSPNPASLKEALSLLEDAEKKLAADQGRPPTSGIDLDKWRQFRDDEIAGALTRGANNRRKGRARESDRLGLASDTRFEVPHQFLPGFYSPLQKALSEIKRDIGTAQEWKAELFNRPGIKKDEIAWTGIDSYLDAQDPKTKLTRSDVMTVLRDRDPIVQETYFGARPGTGDDADTGSGAALVPVGEHQAPVPLEPEHDLPTFDRESPTGTGDFDRDAVGPYIDNNIDAELDHYWENIDSDRLRDLAETASDAAVEADNVADLIRDDELGTFNSIAAATDLDDLYEIGKELKLDHVVDNIQRQLELPGIERTDEQKLALAKSTLNQAAVDVMKKIVEDADSKWGDGASSPAASHLVNRFEKFLDRENVESLLQDPDQMRDTFNQQEYDHAREQMVEQFEQDWDEYHAPQTWTYETADGTEYEIREESRDGGDYDLYVDGNHQSSYRSFQAAADAARGYAMDNAETDDTVEADAANSSSTEMPPQSVYGGKARWQSRSLGGKNYRELVIQVLNLAKDYAHSHFQGVKNPAMHVRTEDLDLPGHGSSLFLTELQSDLGSAGARQGTFSDPDKLQQQKQDDARKWQTLLDEDNALANKQRQLMENTTRDAIYKSADVADLIKAASVDTLPESRAKIAEKFFSDDMGVDGGRSATILRDLWADIQNARDTIAKDKREGNDDTEAWEDNDVLLRARATAIGDPVLMRLRNYLHLGLDPKATVDFNNRIYDNKTGGITTRIGMALINDPRFGAAKPKYDKAASRRAEISALNPGHSEKNPVPAMPWGRHWFEFALKRMVKFSAERGYDNISLPTGPVTSRIEQWGLTPDQIYNGDERTKKMVGAIVKRQDEDAPNVLKALGKPFGVKPVLVDINTGAEVKKVKSKVMAYLGSNGHTAFRDESGRPVAVAHGTKFYDDMVRERVNAASKAFVDRGVGRTIDDMTFTTPADVDLIDNGTGNLGMATTYANAIWVMPIPAEMKEALKKPQPGYRHGGLVRGE